ncbi:MAG: YqeG family HAD IIIA-type phosphatase [Clostridia bacterium]|jgi:HAD superfamily phosphatase (TIGR01668 family)|nr:YqeG family HAD IIIA-type phosphatase [Clostridia bacterium]
MIFYPKIYLKNVKQIPISLLKKNKIKGIILDVDNTLIDYYENLIAGVDKWCIDLKNQGIKFCIASNSNKENKIKKVSEKLNIPYVFFAKKPLKVGLIKAAKIMGLEEKEVAVVGDQIFTDILGANRCKMFSILVEPIKEKDMLITRIKRPIENFIKKSYLKNKDT